MQASDNGRTMRPWLTTEVKWLVENWFTLNTKDKAEFLDRSPGSVREMGARLGLTASSLDVRGGTLTTRQIADRLGISVHTVRGWLREDRLPTAPGYTTMRVREVDLQDFIDRNRYRLAKLREHALHGAAAGYRGGLTSMARRLMGKE